MSSESAHSSDEEYEDQDSLGYSSELARDGQQQFPEGHDIDSAMRHGFAEAYSSEEYLQALEKNYFLYWTDPRHERAGRPKPPSTNPADHKIDWRNRDRIRTASAVLVVCLRIGYDPPDVIKTDPCAKLECWVDPYALAKEKAMERIGKNLQHQFESLAATPKTRYKQYLDPPVEDAKKFCTAARKSAKNERLLFYYNGHGVPKPTPSGELWLFNKQYTQYIPVSLADVVSWLGSPTIMIWDCSAAGNIVVKVQEFGIKRDADIAKEVANPSPPAPTPPPSTATPGPSGAETPTEPKLSIPAVPFRETIQLGACLGNETLPMNPDLPADLFTCCLTSPIEIALRFFLLRNPLKTNLDIDMLLKIPGKLNDRRTPLGELTWIFTAVTDTIAWNTLPRELFQRLFRHDLVVAALFRGFLLAERIMRFYECTPISVPALPQTHNHPLWDSWDLAVDMCLAQLPTLLEHERRWLESLPPQPPTALVSDQPPPPLPPGPPLPYVHSTFFSEQLTAFEIWLEQGSVAKRQHPEQLPVVLQVLLSQAHRLKALILLCKFLDLGPWAVNVALSIGIFAYVLRLLQAPAAELKPVLIYIWARILAVYENCKEDLLKQTYPPTRSVDQAPFTYFVNVLTPSSAPLPIPNVSEHRAMCAFILSVCCRDYKSGQVACMRSNVFEACLLHLRDVDPLLRQWSALCIAQMWDDFEEAKGLGVRARAHELFCAILHTDDVPEVRASVLYALGTLLGTTGSSSPTKMFGRSIACTGPAAGLSSTEQTDVELGVAMSTLKCSADGSPIVRRELVILLSGIVNEHQGQFIIAAYRAIVDRGARYAATEKNGGVVEPQVSTIAGNLIAAAASDEGPSNPAFQAAMFSCMYQCLFDLLADPHPDVAQLATEVMDQIFVLLFVSPLGPAARAVLDSMPTPATPRHHVPPIAATVLPVLDQGRSDSPRFNGPSLPPGSKRATTMAAIKSIAFLGSNSAIEPSAPPSALRSNGYSSGRLNILSQSPEATSPISPLHQSASTDSLRYLQSRAGNKPTRKIRPLTPPDIGSVDLIIAGLIVEDEERLRRRRAMPTTQVEGPVAQVLPLKSSFFDFSLEYYKESQMKPTESDEPGSILHNERVWRRARNEAIIIKTQPLKDLAGSSRWDEQIGFWNNEATPSQVLFHQFEPHLMAADEKGNVTVYDWTKSTKLNRFANGGPSGCPITTLKLCNEDDIALLLTGTADGQVRLFRHYESPTDVHLVSAFRGITDVIPSTIKDPGLVVEWQQGRGHLLMGGSTRYIRVWDAPREIAIQDLPTRANSCLTALTCDQVAGNILVAGFGDGGLKVYDRRMPPRDNMVRSYKGYHNAWVQNVHMQRGGNRELVSGSLAGEVCLWDIRLTEPVRTVQAHQGGMVQLAVHEHAPIFATGSTFNVVKVWNLAEEEPVSKFRNTFGTPNQKIAPMTSLAFHPHLMILAAGGSDGAITSHTLGAY